MRHEEARRTGRTSRMLADAAHEAKAGRYVIVFGASRAHADMLLDQFIREYGGERAGATPKVYIGSGGSVTFEDARASRIDWYGMKAAGAHPSCLSLFDHYAIEHEFPGMLAMLHRYDFQPDEGNDE